MCVAKKLRLVLNGPRPMTRRCSRRARPRPTAKRMQMKYTVVMVPSATRTRVLVSHGTDELLRAIAKRLKLSRKTVRRLLARGPERKPPSSEPRSSLLDAYDQKTTPAGASTPDRRSAARHRRASARGARPRRLAASVLVQPIDEVRRHQGPGSR